MLLASLPAPPPPPPPPPPGAAAVIRCCSSGTAEAARIRSVTPPEPPRPPTITSMALHQRWAASRDSAQSEYTTTAVAAAAAATSTVRSTTQPFFLDSGCCSAPRTASYGIESAGGPRAAKAFSVMAPSPLLPPPAPLPWCRCVCFEPSASVASKMSSFSPLKRMATKRRCQVCERLPRCLTSRNPSMPSRTAPWRWGAGGGAGLASCDGGCGGLPPFRASGFCGGGAGFGGGGGAAFPRNRFKCAFILVRRAQSKAVPFLLLARILV